MRIDYAIVGAMALNEYGYRRVTEDVDILLTADGFSRFKQQWLGRGYVEKSPGSHSMRDTENNITIDVVLSGEYPDRREDARAREFAESLDPSVREKYVELWSAAQTAIE